jgi:DNA-binding protein HU-beta
VIDAFTEVVREDVSRGQEVRLMGFGTWNLRDVAPRRVKSIRGGNQITIPARKRVGFSVGAVLSQAAHNNSPKSSSKNMQPNRELQSSKR